MSDVGTSCDEADNVGGHYYEDMSEDPWTTTYTSDSIGSAMPSFEVAEFTLDDAYPVSGRTIVVHAADGTRVACGVLEEGTYASIGAYPDYGASQSGVFGVYPGYDGDYVVSGSVQVSDQADGGILLRYEILSGPRCVGSGGCGIHIHEGTTCDVADDVGGHYYEGMSDDPWDTFVVADDDSTDHSGDIEMGDFTVSGDYPVAGRAVVLHDTDGTRIACALLKDIMGHVMITQDAANTIGVTGALMNGPLGGGTGGAHVHEGTSCDVADDVGGHYYEGMATDPWDTTLDFTTTGTTATGNFWVSGFTADANDDVNLLSVENRAFVIHNADGDRIGCGVLEEVA